MSLNYWQEQLAHISPASRSVDAHGVVATCRSAREVEEEEGGEQLACQEKPRRVDKEQRPRRTRGASTNALMRRVYPILPLSVRVSSRVTCFSSL
jgi:hypothetical protein